MNKRRFLRDFGAYLAATSAACFYCNSAAAWLNEIEDQSSKGESWVDTSPQPSGQQGSGGMPRGAFKLEGCALSGNFSGPAGFRFLPTTGNPAFDRIISEEAGNLAFITGLQPSLAFLDDRNAP